jgi:hypothetical protein
MLCKTRWATLVLSTRSSVTGLLEKFQLGVNFGDVVALGAARREACARL